MRDVTDGSVVSSASRLVINGRSEVLSMCCIFQFQSTLNDGFVRRICICQMCSCVSYCSYWLSPASLGQGMWMVIRNCCMTSDNVWLIHLWDQIIGYSLLVTTYGTGAYWSGLSWVLIAIPASGLLDLRRRNQMCRDRPYADQQLTHLSVICPMSKTSQLPVVSTGHKWWINSCRLSKC